MSQTTSAADAKLTWLITGCSSGFGLSLTRHALSKGHEVIATSRKPQLTPELVSEVESKGGRWLQLDVNDLQSGKIIDELEQNGHHIDILVNNAGFSVFSAVETMTEDEARMQMDTLYFGPLRLIRSMLPHMRSRKAGTIVNISSGASLEGTESMGGYAAGKAALDGVTKVMAKEVAQFNIRTLTVILGTFNTNFDSTGAKMGSTPLPTDYSGSMVDRVMQVISDGTMKPNGDKDKAMQALYQVIVAEGVGKGREGERIVPLGTDMTARLQLVRNQLGHALDVFEDVTSSVAL